MIDVLPLQCADHPREDGVIRVDNYWCHSAILSTRSSSSSASDHTSGSHVVDNKSGSNEGLNIENKSQDDHQSTDHPNDENTSSTPSPSHQQQQSKSKFPMIIRSPADLKVFQERRKKLEERAKQNWKKFGSRFRIPNAKAPRRSIDQEDDERNQNQKNNNNDRGSAFDEQDTTHSSSSSSSHIAAVDLPGTSFITLFCDDQKVPLPPTIVDILSKQGEKLVPDSISSLHEVARGTVTVLHCCIMLCCVVLCCVIM